MGSTNSVIYDGSLDRQIPNKIKIALIKSLGSGSEINNDSEPEDYDSSDDPDNFETYNKFSLHVSLNFVIYRDTDNDLIICSKYHSKIIGTIIRERREMVFIEYDSILFLWSKVNKRLYKYHADDMPVIHDYRKDDIIHNDPLIMLIRYLRDHKKFYHCSEVSYMSQVIKQKIDVKLILVKAYDDLDIIVL